LAPSRIASAWPARVLAAVGAVSAFAFGFAACGDSGSGSGSGSSSTTGQQANARQGLFSDPKVQACLKEQGVDVSNLRRGNGNGPPNGQPPTGTDGQPPNGTDGQPPSGQRPPNGGFGNSAQGEKLRKALQKCGVTLPNRGQNGSPPQQQGTTPSDTTAS
jgi:hypothetical protein